MVRSRDDVVGLDSSIILPREVWVASGHVQAFTDPLIECQSCHRRLRQDELQEAHAAKHGIEDPDSVGLEQLVCPTLSIIKSMMLADKSLNRAIIVSSSKEGDLINYSDIESRFMFNFGDGASAVLLEKNYRRNIILQSHMISDGRFANDVMVKGVGCVNFANFDEMDSKDKYLCVRDLKSMKEKLDSITFDNFVQVIHKALEKSGYDFYDVGYLAPIFMKRSMLVNLLEKFELTEENTFLLEDYGHCQSEIGRAHV